MSKTKLSILIARSQTVQILSTVQNKSAYIADALRNKNGVMLDMMEQELISCI